MVISCPSIKKMKMGHQTPLDKQASIFMEKTVVTKKEAFFFFLSSLVEVKICSHYTLTEDLQAYSS